MRLAAHASVSELRGYQLIHDMTDLDGRPNLNLASFVHTWMPPQADKLMAENVSKNLIDEDEVRSLLRATALIAVVPGHGRHAPPVTLTASLNGC